MRSILTTLLVMVTLFCSAQDHAEKIAEANQLYFNEKYNEALAQYEELLTTSFTDSLEKGRIYGYAGVCCGHLSMTEKEEKYLKESVAHHAPEIVFYNKLYSIAKKKKDYLTQEFALVNKLDVFPEEAFSIYNSLSVVYLNSKQYDKVIEVCTLLSDERPDKSKYWYYRGIAHQQLKQNYKAVEAFQSAYDLEPTNINVNKYLGLLLFSKANADYSKEVKRYKAMKSPNNADWDKHFAYRNAIFKRMDEAELYLLTAYRVKPSEQLRKALETVYIKTKQTEKISTL